MNKSLEKLFENGLIMRTKDVPIPEKIKTTSILLDYILQGGLNTRRISQIYGQTGAGKTTLCACIANNALKQYPEKYILYIDTEQRASIDWLGQFIEDTSRILFMQPSVIEEVGNNVREIVNSGIELSMIILDSVAGAGTARSFDKDLNIAQVGGASMAIGAMLRVLAPICNKNNICFLLVNQARDVIGGYGPSIPQYNGGNALKHSLDYCLYLRKTSNKIMAKDEFGNDYPIGYELAVKIVKGQGVGKVIKMNFYFEKTENNELGFDRIDEVVKLSVALGLIEKAAASYKYEKFPDGKIVGQNKLVEFLRDKNNSSILEELESKLYNRLNKKVVVEDVEFEDN